MNEHAPPADRSAGEEAMLAAALLAVDPHGLGGVWIEARRCAAVDQWLAAVQHLCSSLGPVRRVPLSIADSRLLGGLDLTGTLARGRPVAERGLLAEADGGVILISNVESARQLIVSAVCAALDTGHTVLERDGLNQIEDAHFGVIAINESGEACAPALRERIAILLHFDGAARLSSLEIDAAAVHRARAALPFVQVSPEIIEGLCTASFMLGAGSVRTEMLALRVARAAAALERRDDVSAADAALAVRLVIAPRATRLPSTEDEQQEQPEPPPPQDPQEDHDANSSEPIDQNELDEMLVAAALAALPPNVLEQLKHARNDGRRGAGTGRAGTKQKARLHGRRARSRRGDPRDGAPLDVLETIRAAAPWQKLRRLELLAAQGEAVQHGRPVEVRRQDFRVRTFKNYRETATIFAVDASGSSALHRLAEAKGAIELLLADCYSRRDHVALIAFRGKSAELVLPPTRSLARVKKALAALPGGGGTPLASAAHCAAALAEAARRKGQTPTVVFLTDGKANIDRNGVGSRERGEADALEAARAFKSTGLTALVIDTSPRPAPQSRRFAAEMDASYLPLPHANAHMLSEAVRAEVK